MYIKIVLLCERIVKLLGLATNISWKINMKWSEYVKEKYKEKLSTTIQYKVKTEINIEQTVKGTELGKKMKKNETLYLTDVIDNHWNSLLFSIHHFNFDEY